MRKHRPKTICLLLACIFAFCLTSQAAIKVIILAGQSNAEGVNSDHRDLPSSLSGLHPDISFFDRFYNASRGWEQLDPPNSRKREDQGYGPWGFGPEVTLGRAIADETGEDVYIVKMAWGGTSLERDWLNPLPIYTNHKFNVLTEGRLYDRMKAGVDEARSRLTAQTGQATEVAAFFWMQGEADASNNFDANGNWIASFHTIYEDNLNELAGMVRSDFGNPTMPFILGRIGDDFTSNNKWINVRNAQVSFANSDPNAYWVDTDSFVMSNDNLHYNSTGYQQLGNAFADVYLDLIGSGQGGNAVTSGAIHWLSNAPTVLPLSGNFTMWANYTSNGDADLIVDILTADGNFSWKGGTRITGLTADSNKTITIPLTVRNGPLVSGQSYWVTSKLVPPGAPFNEKVAQRDRLKQAQ